MTTYPGVQGPENGLGAPALLRPLPRSARSAKKLDRAVNARDVDHLVVRDGLRYFHADNRRQRPEPRSARVETGIDELPDSRGPTAQRRAALGDDARRAAARGASRRCNPSRATPGSRSRRFAEKQVIKQNYQYRVLPGDPHTRPQTVRLHAATSRLSWSSHAPRSSR